MSLDPRTDVYSPIRAGNVDGVSVFHDKALIKAELAHHKVSKFGKARRTLFVWDLSYKTKGEEIQQFFQRYGEIRSVDVIRDVVTRISKGYAFVEFKKSKEALNAANKADKTILAGRPVRCQIKVGGVLQGWRPRRLGGGFGGRKTSGQMRFGGKDNPFSSQKNKSEMAMKTDQSTSSVETGEDDEKMGKPCRTFDEKSREKR